MARIKVWAFKPGFPDDQARTIDEWIEYLIENEPTEDQISVFEEKEIKE